MKKIKFPQLVKCVNANAKVSFGECYAIDLATIWMDSDGDAYVDVYDYDDDSGLIYIGELRLNRFQSIQNIESQTIA